MYEDDKPIMIRGAYEVLANARAHRVERSPIKARWDNSASTLQVPEQEEIKLVTCFNGKCKYNIDTDKCIWHHIFIDSDGVCAQFSEPNRCARDPKARVQTNRNRK